MTVRRVNPAELARPSGFAHAVVTQARRVVFLAGQTALDGEGHIVGDGIVGQFERALRNVLTALTAAGGSAGDLVSMTVYIVDMDGYRAKSREIGAVWRTLVGTEYPAMAAIGVHRLWDVEALVELHGIAAVGGS
jgi:enamine deaminase RidA (YjgF/YER057c/UK114 family)